jgi:hypothetical protein
MRLSRRAFVGSVAAFNWPRTSGTARIVDLGGGCLLRESLYAFRSVLAEDTIACPAATIVPGAGIWHWYARGPVLLECALGLLQGRTRPGAPYVPYVDFTWPVPVKIREFFPHVLEPRPGDFVIASYAGAPVALRRGGLILLGSPIGPSLAAGDPDARRWLASVLRWFTSAYKTRT